MNATHLLLLVLLVAFGILVGCFGGVIAAKRGNDLSVVIIPTALWTTGLLLVFLFIWAASEAIFMRGFNLGRALLFGFGYVFMLGLWAPIVTAFPTAIATIIAYLVTQRCGQRRFAEQATSSNH